MTIGKWVLVGLVVVLAFGPAHGQEPVLNLADGGLEFPDGTVQATAASAGPAAVEDSGQATCYDASGATTAEVSCTGTGQDGELRAGVAWPTPRFTDNGDGTVTDDLTGLVWLQDANCDGLKKPLQAALDWVASLNTTSVFCLNYAAGTFTDWRLPNINELASLVNDGRYPALPAGHPFKNLQEFAFYWSSTTAAWDPDRVWLLSMNFGEPSSFSGKNSETYVWPVRGGPSAAAGTVAPSLILADGGLEFPDGTVQTTAGGSALAPVEKTGQQTCYDASGATGEEVPCAGTGQDGDVRAGVAWPTPRFTDNDDGTVTDNLTGLVWLKDANCAAGKTWQAALAWVAAFNGGSTACTDHATGTFADWRLPNIKELSSLMDRGQSGLPLPSGHPFVNVQSSASYWSSTSDTFDPSRVKTASTFDGSVSHFPKTTEGLFVWPVRSGR